MIQTGKELAAAARDVAENCKTLYVRGAFGWPMNTKNKCRVKAALSFNRRPDRLEKINAAGADTFGFDCICLVKGLLWGFIGDEMQDYGGAVYEGRGVPDINESQMLNACTDVSGDFSTIQPGEYLWTEGHCGIYVGGGQAVECTYRWADGVQVTWVYNIAGECDEVGRHWTKHGKLPYVTYEPAAKGKDHFYLSLGYLRTGSRGAYVRAVQNLLIGRGYDCGPEGADGKFGSNTTLAVRLFQRDCGIESDGVVGEDTLSRLLGVVL